MFRHIMTSSLRFPFLVLGIALALIAYGASQLQRMPVDVLPEFAPPIVEIQTEAIGLSAEEVERIVTFTLEELLTGVPWLESTRSRSVTGLSSIMLIFKRGTDILRARQMVQERLTLAAMVLPNLASPPVILQPLSATSRFMMIGISSDKIDPTELSLIARWTIKPRLLGVPGVANVAIWGQRLQQMQVHFTPDRLRESRLTQEDIIAAAGDALWVSPLTFLRASTPGAGGWIDNPNQRLGVQHTMPIETPEDMAKVAVTSPILLLSGKSMALGDVTETRLAHPPLIGDAIINRGGNGLLLVLEKFPSTNTLEVTRGVDEAIGQLALGLPGVKIDTDLFRLASYVDASISNLSQAIILGGILSLVAIAAFLYDWRSVFISAASILISLLAALIVLYLAGLTINTMILAGLMLALSVIISDVIVDADRVRMRLRSSKEASAPLMSIICETMLETRSATTYATLAVVLAVIPIFFMGGVAGAFFEPLAISYLLAIATSLAVALSVTPALSLLLERTAAGQQAEPPLISWFYRFYEKGMLRAWTSPRRILAAAGVTVLAGLAMGPFLGQSLLPSLRENAVIVNWNAAPGTSHPEAYRVMSRVTEELRGLPGVRNVSAHLGRAITGDQIVGINDGQIWVGLDPGADYDRTVARIRETIDGYPGIDRSLQNYLRDKIGEVLTGESKPIVVRLFGPKREILQQQAEKVRQALASVSGITDLRVAGQAEEPQIRIRVDAEAAARADVRPGDVRRSSSTVFSGITVGFLFKEQKIFDVVVWGAPEARQSLTNLKNLWVEKSDRTHVRLGDVADVSIASVPTVIRHERIAPYMDVTANVAGRDAGSVFEEVEAKLAGIPFPLEYHPELLGEFAEREGTQRRMIGVSIAAAIGIFLLLQACFQSWRLALISYLSLPAALAGGIFAIWLSGGTISLGSVVGFLAVLGVAARNSTLLITHYQQMASGQKVAPGFPLILQGTREQLSPLLASSVAILAAMLPLIAFGAAAGLEFIQPMAIVIIGGLIAADLFALFVLPVLYLLTGTQSSEEPDLILQGT